MSPTRAFFKGFLAILLGIIGNLLAAYIEKTMLGSITLFQFVAMAIFILVFLVFESAITKYRVKKKFEASKDVKDKIAHHRRNVQKLKQQYDSQFTWTINNVEYWQDEQERIAELKQELKEMDEEIEEIPLDTMPPPPVGKLLSTAEYIKYILQTISGFLIFLIAITLSLLLAPLSQNYVISTVHTYEFPLAVPTPTPTMIAPTNTPTPTIAPTAEATEAPSPIPEQTFTPTPAPEDSELGSGPGINISLSTIIIIVLITLIIGITVGVSMSRPVSRF